MIVENGLKVYTADELKEILELHKKWINGEDGGIRASLERANLNGASLDGANLERANLNRASLYGADLNGADLNGANLDGADLNGVLGNLKHLKAIQCEKYYVTYTSKVIQIGCQRHTIEEWQNFNNEKIKDMDNGALEWWTKWKTVIFQIIEMSPAEPTGYVEEEK